MSEIDVDFPGAEMITRGLADLKAERPSAEALLVAIGAPRLRMAGLEVPPFADALDRPQERLFALLSTSHGDGAHAALNALIRRLIGFEHALEARIYRERRAINAAR